MANEINGSDLFIWADDVLVANATSHTLSFKMSTRDTSNKDSGTFNTRDVARFDVSGSCDGLMVYAGGYDTLIDKMKLRVPVTMEFGQKQAGTTLLDTTVWYASGDFIITGMDLTAGDQENATYSCTFEHYENFDFTPHASLSIRIVGTGPALHDGVTGSAAVFVTGGIEPYTYAWTGGTGPTLNGIPAVWGLNGTYEGVTHTCTVTDSTPVTPLTGTASIVLYSPIA